MSITVNERPPSISLAGNQMWADVSTDRADEDFIGLHFKVQLYEDSEWVTQGQELRYEPDSDGNVKIDVHSLLEWDPEKEFTHEEDASSLIHERTSLRKTYRIGVDEKYGNPLTIHDADAGEIKYVLPGKISDLRMGQLNDASTTWEDFFLQNQIFLTNAPRSKVTDPWASERLFFYRYGFGSESMHLKVKVTYSDNTTKEIVRESYSGVYAHFVFEIITSFSTLGIHFLDTSKTIEKYEVWLSKDDDTAISEVYTYILDHTQRDHSKYFLFSNGFKMIEGARFIGPSSSETKVEQISINRTLPKNFGMRDPSVGKAQSLETEHREVDSGWLSEAEINWLREIVMSKEVYEIVNGQPVRVTIETNKVVPHDDNSNLLSLVLTYQYAHADSVPAVLPTLEDVIANFQKTHVDLGGMVNGAAGGYDFDSFTYTEATEYLQAVTLQNFSPHAYSNNDIEFPSVPLLAYYHGYTRENANSVLQILLFENTGYTAKSLSTIVLGNIETGFGILMTEESSVKFGIKGSYSEDSNTHAMFLKLYIPTKRCLEFLYEQSL